MKQYSIIIAFVLLILGSCHRFFKDNTNVSWVTCKTYIDTFTINEDQNRGAWAIHDTLVLWSAIEPMDVGLCDSIGLRTVTLWTPSGNERPCDLADLYPPFRIYKNKGSDTLYVFQNGKTLLFQMPDHMCE